MAETMQEPATDDLSQWTSDVAAPLNLAEMDALILEMKEKEKLRDEKKKDYQAADAELEHAKTAVLEALKASGKSKYHVEGLGTVFVANTYAVTTPKTIEEKRELFNYISKKHGNDTLASMLTINYQSLNSFYNQEAQTAAAEGIATFELPGVGAPTHQEGIRFRKG